MSWFEDKEFLMRGYEKLTNNIRWRQVAEDQAYLYAGVFGHMSELNTWLATAMYPIVASQYAQSLETSRTLHAYNWFEKQYGLMLDDKCNSSYTYRIEDSHYEIMSVSSLILSMVIDADLVSKMYSQSFFSKDFNEPELVNIAYPDMHVKFASYDKFDNAIEFGLKTDCGPIENASFSVKNMATFREATQTIRDKSIDISKNVKIDQANNMLVVSGVFLVESDTNIFYIAF